MWKKLQEIFNIGKDEVVEVSSEDRFGALFKTLSCDVIRVEVGEDIVPFAENHIVDMIWKLRKAIKDKNGFIIPLVRVIDNEDLQENEYLIKVRDKVVYQGFVIPTGEDIEEDVRISLEQVCEDYLEEIFTNEIAEKYIDQVQANNNGWLIWNITNVLRVTDIRLILVALLRDGKSIKDIDYVFDKIGESLSEYRCPYDINSQAVVRSVLNLV